MQTISRKTGGIRQFFPVKHTVNTINWYDQQNFYINLLFTSNNAFCTKMHIIIWCSTVHYKFFGSWDILHEPSIHNCIHKLITIYEAVWKPRFTSKQARHRKVKHCQQRNAQERNDKWRFFTHQLLSCIQILVPTPNPNTHPNVIKI